MFCGPTIKQSQEIALLVILLLIAALIRWVPADIRLPTLILEIDLRLIQRRVEQVLGVIPHPGPCGRANRQPVQPQGVSLGDPVLRVQRQELGPRLHLAAIGHVALELGDDQRQTGDFGGKVAQLDPAEVGLGHIGLAIRLAPALVDHRLDRPHFLVGDDEEVA
ncbi:hypothetical protein GALL_480430 [mine drainage metagenome]|uniref:Uncharacterized protein n=1 Tax=mine drainage metagenome TaxID=410659 RepID=A0A1J5PFE7_9ZZZZ